MQMEENIDVILATNEQYMRARHAKIPEKHNEPMIPIVSL